MALAGIGTMMRAILIFPLLMLVWLFGRIFYRCERRWLDPVPEDRWGDYRVIAILNHTSLFEVIFAAMPPLGFLWSFARKGVIPVADKTLRRPLVGKFFKILARDVIPLTRERDASWTGLLEKVGPDSIIIMLPEGRMKRADGLDSTGRPMTVRGGIADILRAIPDGRMLMAYSAGLHHVHVPGQHFPRLFRTVWMTFEAIDIRSYREQMEERPGRFKLAVISDLEERRDRWCRPPIDLHTGAAPAAPKPEAGLPSDDGDEQPPPAG